MKIIWYKGARSNQIFHCALYKRLQMEYPREKIYGFYHQRFKTDVQDFYELEIPPKNLFSEILGGIFSVLRKSLHINFMCSTDEHPRPNAFFYDGYWQDKTIYESFGQSWLKFRNIDTLSKKNKDMADHILATQSVAIHIRRNDYLKAKSLYGDTQLDYYQKAIDYSKKHLDNPVFYFFSDDINWVRENLGDKDKDYYIDWNTGKDSYLDMYLMSLSKANIIANSTFSYWAAYNRNKTFVIYPREWYTKKSGMKIPNLFPNDWIAM